MNVWKACVYRFATSSNSMRPASAGGSHAMTLVSKQPLLAMRMVLTRSFPRLRALRFRPGLWPGRFALRLRLRSGSRLRPWLRYLALRLRSRPHLGSRLRCLALGLRGGSHLRPWLRGRA